MKKFFKRLFAFVLCLAVAFLLVRFGPYLFERIFGSGNTQWISERFSETLREKNELVVYEIETTGQETVSQKAWLLGTVQKVEIPYTFQMNFTVELTSAQVTATGNTVEVRVPSPKPDFHKLTVDDANMHKSDWLYPLTPERYAAITQEIETKLFEEYSANEEYRKNAWDVTVRNLETLFKTVAEQSEMGLTCTIRVIADDTLGQPQESPLPSQTAE